MGIEGLESELDEVQGEIDSRTSEGNELAQLTRRKAELENQIAQERQEQRRQEHLSRLVDLGTKATTAMQDYHEALEDADRHLSEELVEPVREARDRQRELAQEFVQLLKQVAPGVRSNRMRNAEGGEYRRMQEEREEVLDQLQDEGVSLQAVLSAAFHLGVDSLLTQSDPLPEGLEHGHVLMSLLHGGSARRERPGLPNSAHIPGAKGARQLTGS